MFVYLLTSWCEWLALKIKIKERETGKKKDSPSTHQKLLLKQNEYNSFLSVSAFISFPV